MNMEELQVKRNSSSKQIGVLKSKGEDTTAIMAEVAGLGEQLKQVETEFNEVALQLNNYLVTVTQYSRCFSSCWT